MFANADDESAESSSSADAIASSIPYNEEDRRGFANVANQVFESLDMDDDGLLSVVELREFIEGSRFTYPVERFLFPTSAENVSTEDIQAFIEEMNHQFAMKGGKHSKHSEHRSGEKHEEHSKHSKDSQHRSLEKESFLSKAAFIDSLTSEENYQDRRISLDYKVPPIEMVSKNIDINKGRKGEKRETEIKIKDNVLLNDDSDEL